MSSARLAPSSDTVPLRGRFSPEPITYSPRTSNTALAETRDICWLCPPNPVTGPCRTGYGAVAQ